MKIAVVFALCLVMPGLAWADTLRVAATTSFQNSGLADVLLPLAEDEIGLRVELIVVGTGQALKLGAAGDVDAVLVHSRSAEDAFVEAGHAPHRREIMYNDFVLIGPKEDPARIADAGSAAAALDAVADAQAPFVSRGDDSGTHRRELDLWAATPGATPSGAWYRPVGAGMGAALNTAAAMDAYVLSDRASWMYFANKRDLVLLFEGDPALFNQYAYLPISSANHPHVRAQSAAAFEDWLTSPTTQAVIGAYTIDGQAVFVPNATTASD